MKSVHSQSQFLFHIAMAKKHLTNAEKLGLIALSRERQAQGESLSIICRDFGIQPKQIRYWRKYERLIADADGDKKTIYRGGYVVPRCHHQESFA